MPRFASREEYEAWKASGQGSGSGAAMTAASAVGAPAASPAVAPAKKKEGFKETFSGLPWWAWVFVVACLVIPLITRGGALPTGIAFGAASGCAQVAKKADWETPPRVLACAGIAAGAWLLVFGLLASIFARG